MPTTTCTRSRRPSPSTCRRSTRGHQVRAGERAHQDRRQQQDQRLHPQPHLRASWPPPGRRSSTSRRATPRASPAGRSWARASGPTRVRRPRAAHQAARRAGHRPGLIWPTLASLLEERVHDNPPAVHAVVHAFNQWMEEHWTFNYENRMFPTPVIHLGIVDEAIKELDWVLERGARIIWFAPRRSGASWDRVRRPCPSSTRSGPRWPRRTSWWACTRRTAGTSATPTSGRVSPTAR
jgi:hypothetical protein